LPEIQIALVFFAGDVRSAGGVPHIVNGKRGILST
jgi:hypothetical protein